MGDPDFKVNCENNDFYAYPSMDNIPESHRGRWISFDELLEAIHEQKVAEYDEAYADEVREDDEKFIKNIVINETCQE